MKKNILLAFGSFFISVCFAELFISLFFYFPSLNRYFPYVRHAVVDIYMNHERSSIQWKPDCSRYDSVISYTLLPGQCTFANREFSTQYLINSAGLRDDEESLVRPEIIVLGDSYAMGWGVEQDSTFEALIQKKTNKKALNAGISSYGTARELLLFERLDKSALRYLIVQYCENDYVENKSFTDNDNKLRVMTEDSYYELVKKEVSGHGYYPFQFLRTLLNPDLLRSVWNHRFSNDGSTARIELQKPKYLSASIGKSDKKQKKESDQKTDGDDVDVQVETFLNILSKFQMSDSVQVILLNLSYPQYDVLPFYKSLNSQKSDINYGKHVNNAIVLNTSNYLNKEHYYILDDHLNTRGHELIAEKITDIILQSEKERLDNKVVQ